MTEIEQIEDKIIEAIQANVPGIITCDTWQGELADLLPQGNRLPAVWIIYTGETHGEKRVIGSNTHDKTMRFDLALAIKNLRSRQAGASGAYQYIEQIIEVLTGLSLSPLSGFIWPGGVELALIEAGTFVYRLNFERRAY